MATYLTPGVYVEEVASGNKPIAGVGTGTGAFVGITQKGPVNKATLVTSWTQFVNTFGIDDSHRLTDSVYDFFNEGGSKCYIVRVVHYEVVSTVLTKQSAPSSLALYDGATTPAICMTVAVHSDGSWSDGLYKVQVLNSVDPTFDLKVYLAGTTDTLLETFTGLTNATAPNIVSNYITITGVAGVTTVPADLAATLLNVGSDGLTGFGTADIKGDISIQTGFHALDTVDEVSLIAAPDVHSISAVDDATVLITVKDGLDYCASRKDCFFIGEPGPGLSPTGVVSWMATVNSSYGAIYYPWVESNNGGVMPPSGMVMGAIARTDAARGVHKAPAGITDGYLRSALSLEKLVTAGERKC